ncbi:MAG: CBS domain-containing protein [Firmicutes bacterium]|nr:CBS domain-containing protein [Bacillota bacterium]
MKRSRSNAEAFLAVYNELDRYMRVKLGKENWVSHPSLLREMAKTDKLFKLYHDLLCDMAELRNAIVHNPHSGKIEPIAEPHAEIVKLYTDIKEAVLHPPLALETIAVPRRDIYTTTMDANARSVMQTMIENSYTHVPVLQGETLAGVFSENTVFSYLARHHICALDRDICIGEFAEFIPLNKHVSERFEFVPRKATVADVEELFAEEIKDQKRLAAVFITETGKAGEKILGLVTPWDLARDNPR